MRTSKNLVNHELIGLRARISDSTNKKIIGKSGKIVDETKNMFTFENKELIFNIQKSNSTFEFSLNKKWVNLDGKNLLGRPEERLKKRIKVKKW